jgi:hypothetical protein
MKTLTHLLPISPKRAATVVAISCFGLTAFAAPQPGPVAAAPSPATGAHSGPPAPAAAEEDILDIRGPIHIPTAFPWVSWAVGSLAGVGLGFAAWKLLRRPRRKLPYEIALERLEQTRPLMVLESPEPFSFAVSEVVRFFIEECLPVRAAHRTTNEFLHDLLKLPDSVLAEHRGALEDFLTHCDLTKFARWSLTVPQMEALLASAREFVIAIGKPAPAKKRPATPDPTPSTRSVAVAV